MTSNKAREFLRSHVLGLVAIFIALTGTAVAGQQSSSGGPEASASVVTDAKFKKLKKRVAALEAKTTPTIPTSLPPSGPAGGDLTGTYPNPLIGPNAVGSAEVINESLAAVDIAANAIGSSEITDGSVGSAELQNGGIQAADLSDNIVVRAANIVVPGGGTAENGNYDTESTTASCLGGEEVIAGGTTWIGGPFADAELWTGEVHLLTGTEQVFATGGNDSGTARTLQVHAYCLL